MTQVLEIAGLVKTFGGLTATDNVTLTVNAGEIHALIGPNGAGKSTLINQICGELIPNAGHIHLAGRDITKLPPADRVALGLGRTFQITSLLDDMTVRQTSGWQFRRARVAISASSTARRGGPRCGTKWPMC